MPYRSYRGSRRRRSPRHFGKTYKKVLNIIPASYTSGFANAIIMTGVDGAAIGQTSNTDGSVPTGSHISTIIVQFAAVNLAAAACFIGTTLQYKLEGQSFIDPTAVGGDPQRNQVLNQNCLAAGESQSVNRTFAFKIPKQFQRLKEGMKWSFTWSTNATVSATLQIIYIVKQ